MIELYLKYQHLQGEGYWLRTGQVKIESKYLCDKEMKNMPSNGDTYLPPNLSSVAAQPPKQKKAFRSTIVALSKPCIWYFSFRGAQVDIRSYVCL